MYLKYIVQYMDNIYLSYYYLLIDYLYKIQRIENKIENNCDNVFSFYRNLLQENWSILTYIYFRRGNILLLLFK